MIVMEYFPVGNLEDYIKKNFTSTPRSLRLQWCDEMGQALHYLHVSGIIHRDVKPPNFLLTTSLSVKLGDFGVTKQIQTDEELDEQFATAARTRRKVWRGRRAFMPRPVSRYIEDARVLSLKVDAEVMEATEYNDRAVKFDETNFDHTSNSVSYTHLTLPTILRV